MRELKKKKHIVVIIEVQKDAYNREQNRKKKTLNTNRIHNEKTENTIIVLLYIMVLSYGMYIQLI